MSYVVPITDIEAWGQNLEERHSERPLVYIAHPLRGDWEANLADARLWVRAALDAGFAPVAPYLMTEGILREPQDRELGLELDLATIAKCDLVWLCGPVISEGMALEREEALRRHIPVIHWLSREDALREVEL